MMGPATDDSMAHAVQLRLETHLVHVTLIAFPLQQWLQEGVWMLRYTYIACLVITGARPVPVYI